MPDSDSALEHLRRLPTLPEADIDLAASALQLARLYRPELDPAPVLEVIDSHAAAVRERIPAQAPASLRASVLRDLLFDTLGYVGNADDYEDPRNSFLDQVVERRLGIPISLSVVYVSVGRRLGLDVAGVSFPAHFLVRLQDENGSFIIDPFNGGQVLEPRQLDSRLRRVYGSGAPTVAAKPALLRPVGTREVLVRMLRNLKSTYMKRLDHAEALIAIEGVLALEPDLAEEIRDRGLAYAGLGRYAPAVSDLRRYLKAAQDAREAAELTRLIESIDGLDSGRLH